MIYVNASYNNDVWVKVVAAMGLRRNANPPSVFPWRLEPSA